MAAATPRWIVASICARHLAKRCRSRRSRGGALVWLAESTRSARGTRA
jgi:hypothetical protein